MAGVSKKALSLNTLNDQVAGISGIPPKKVLDQVRSNLKNYYGLMGNKYLACGSLSTIKSTR